MYEGLEIKPPFFEVGPKAYLYGKKALELAKEADRISEKYQVQIIFTPQYVDIPIIARETKNLWVFAQHMDPITAGKGMGSVLPEALKEAGAVGVFLNHSERRLTLSEINKAIKRADEVGLVTLVCADSPEEAAALAHLNPNIILAEPPELIGSRNQMVGERNYITEINTMIKNINPRIHVMHAAGIWNGEDVYKIVSMGAEGTGSTSGIVKADNPARVLEEMIQAMRTAWSEKHVK